MRRALLLAFLAAGCGQADRPTPSRDPKTAEPRVAAPAEEEPHPDTLTEASHYEPPAHPIEQTDIDVLPVAELVARNRAAMERNRDAPVHVIQSRAPREAGRQLCEAVVPHRAPETPVLLKPNLSGMDRFAHDAEGDQGWQLRTVNVDFVRGVVDCLHARGHTEITIIDAWSPSRIGHGYFDVTGLSAMAEEEHVRLVTLWEDDPDGRSPVVRAPYPGAHQLTDSLLVPRILADHLLHGLYISIPKMKMHRFTVMSLGIKNAMGVVILSPVERPHNESQRMHEELHGWWRAFRREHEDDRELYVRSLELFAERIVDVLEIQMPDAVLIDGIPPVAGDGFSLIEPYDDGVAIGGVNPVTVEAVGMEYMGYLDNAELEAQIQHRTSPVLEEAARRFYGDTAILSGVQVVGDASFRDTPRVAHFRGLPEFEIGAVPDPMGALPWAD